MKRTKFSPQRVSFPVFLYLFVPWVAKIRKEVVLISTYLLLSNISINQTFLKEKKNRYTDYKKDANKKKRQRRWRVIRRNITIKGPWSSVKQLVHSIMSIFSDKCLTQAKKKILKNSGCYFNNIFK